MKKKKIKKYGLDIKTDSSLSEPSLAYTNLPPISFKILEKFSGDRHSHLVYIKKGLSYGDLIDVMNIASIHLDDMASILHVTSRTLRRLDPNVPLSTFISERLLEIITLYKLGLDVFDDLEVFNTWMRRPIQGIGFKVPFELLDTSLGIDIVKDALFRLAYGVYA